MAKKRKTPKKKTSKRKIAKKSEAKQVEVQFEAEVMRGRFANHIQVSLQDEEFALDFLARVGEKATLVSRIFITPEHAQRLVDLLRRQVTNYRKLQRAKKKR